jgi:YVTN family beta-propeller protein
MNLRNFGLIITITGIFGSASGLAQNAYITNATSNNVSVIDTATDMVIATIPVGSFPFGVAVSPDGRKVYVAKRWLRNRVSDRHSDQ